MYYPEISAIFEGGIVPADYFASLQNYRNMVLSLYKEAAVDEADATLVAEALQRRPEIAADRGALQIVVLTEDWCGDSATTVPYIARLAEALDIPIRVFRQSVFPDLKQWYLDQGTDHIPVVSLVHGNVELFRWIERPEAAHSRFKEWIAEHPQMPQLRARKDEDEEAAKEYFKLYASLLREMSSWYRGGLWREIPREWAAALDELQ